MSLAFSETSKTGLMWRCGLYDLLFIYCPELATSTVSLTGEWAQGDVSKQYTYCTVLPAKSDSDVMFCLQLLSKISTCTLHLS